MIHRSSRVVARMAAIGAVGSSCLFLACGGERTVFDREEVDAGGSYGETDPGGAAASAGAAPSTVCCETEPDGTLSCGSWVSSTPDSCPEGYTLYTSGGASGGVGADAGVEVDAGATASFDAGTTVPVDAGVCPVVCAPSQWPTPDGLGCCAIESDGVQCSEGSYPPVFVYPVAATFGVLVPDPDPPRLTCPEGSTPTPWGTGCCIVNRDGYEVCGEYGPALDLDFLVGDAGRRDGATLGISWAGGCAGTGVCCPANSAFTNDELGCCTVDSAGFTLCIHGGTRAETGEPFFAGSVVPWPWGPPLDCPIPLGASSDAGL
jgi:hypothetical protein